MGKPLRVISLGWGVQSFTLAAMAALGEIEPVDYAIHADTTHEMQGTYAHAAKYRPWLEEKGIPVVTVKAKDGRVEVVREDWSASVMIPAFTNNLDGEMGQVRRQCTHDWKIMPIRRFLRSIVNPTPGAVESLQGISLDEWQRMRTSDVKYITNVYPLVDMRITRASCVSWLQDKGLDVPPKSACTFCPYHSLGQWKRLKQGGGPDWEEAQSVDEAIRHKRELGEGKPGHEIRNGVTLYVHPSRKPLAEAIAIPEDYGAEQMEFEMPCDSGMCFV